MTALVAATACGDPAAPAAAPTTTTRTIVPTTEGPPCRDAALADAAVTFANANGATLHGYLLGDGATGVVLANQLRVDACIWAPYAKKLAERGYRVLAFDFNSDHGSEFVAGSTDDGDVAAAAGFLRERGSTSIVLLGTSRGGTAVLIAATRIQPPVAGVISLSGPISVNGMDALAAVPNLAVPVLYVVSDRDRPFAAHAQTLFDATPASLGKLVILEGLGHGVQYPLGSATTSERAMQAVDEFLSAHAPVT
jgi:pimeloyl-ACP methyl ester carboxylesterase